MVFAFVVHSSPDATRRIPSGAFFFSSSAHLPRLLTMTTPSIQICASLDHPSCEARRTASRPLSLSAVIDCFIRSSKRHFGFLLGRGRVTHGVSYSSNSANQKANAAWLTGGWDEMRFERGEVIPTELYTRSDETQNGEEK